MKIGQPVPMSVSLGKWTLGHLPLSKILPISRLACSLFWGRFSSSWRRFASIPAVPTGRLRELARARRPSNPAKAMEVAHV